MTISAIYLIANLFYRFLIVDEHTYSIYDLLQKNDFELFILDIVREELVRGEQSFHQSMLFDHLKLQSKGDDLVCNFALIHRRFKTYSRYNIV